nr:Uma2 family endonuclease [Romeria gracilis]
MIAKSHAYFTPEDYLEIERISPIKHEYLQGQMVAMAGATKTHVIITGNLSALLVNHLRGKACIAYAMAMKVRLPELGISDALGLQSRVYKIFATGFFKFSRKRLTVVWLLLCMS